MATPISASSSIFIFSESSSFNDNNSINSSSEYQIFHPIDTSAESRQKGIECVHNCFDRIHRYITSAPVPDAWEEELSLGMRAYQSAFRQFMQEVGHSMEFIEELLKTAESEGIHSEELKNHLSIPDKFKLDKNSSFLNLISEDRTLEYSDLSIDEQYAIYEQNPSEMHAHYIPFRFDQILSEHLKASAKTRKGLIERELKTINLTDGEPRELAAVRAAKAGFVFLKEKKALDAVLSQTPVFAGGSLVRKFDPILGWGAYEYLSKHATVIVGTNTNNNLIVSDPLHPDYLRVEDRNEFLSKVDKLYYFNLATKSDVALPKPRIPKRTLPQ